MDTYADRLKAALKDSGKTQTQLADAVGVKQQTIQYLCSRGKGSTKNQKIADYLGVSARWLETGEGSQHVGTESNVTYLSQVEHMVPLVSWVRAGEFCEAHDPFQSGDAEEWIPKPPGAGKNTYSLRIKGDSMTSPYPTQRSYPEGMIIIVDPSKEVLPGMRGIFKLPDSNEVTFKELVSDAGKLYLKPLNPVYDKILVEEDMVTCGKVIAAYFPE